MPPPAWALLERALLRFDSEACEWFAGRYVDERGYLLHTPRWGTLDGPDDAIETFFNWTLLHALGGSDSVVDLYKKAQEGHWRQYNELRTKLTELASNGAYHKEFITMSDWFHTGEGMRAFMLLGLSEPNDPRYRERMTRFAGLYMNEDADAPNYDPVNKVIKSIWNGSKGPMLRKATVYDWVGDPVPGRYHLLHSGKRGEMLDLDKAYPKMLAHCNEYLDSVGDNSLNLAATVLAANAYMLTGNAKYRNWIIEYVNAWKERTAQTGGNIPSNIGLDGKPGGEYKGQWWKGTYGWNFTIFDGEIEQIAHRNYFTGGALDRLQQRTAGHRRPGIHRRPPAADGQHLCPEEGRKRPDFAASDVRRPAWLQVRRAAKLVPIHHQPVHRPADRDLHVVDGPQRPGASPPRRAGSAFWRARIPSTP